MPGLDGTGKSFEPILPLLPADCRVTVVRYPTARLLSFEETVECAASQIPTGHTPVVIAESFSGPVAVSMIASGRVRARALVLCATFARSPHPVIWRIASFFRLTMLIRADMPKALFKFFTGDGAQAKALLPLWKKVHAEVPPEILSSRLSLINTLNVTPDLRKLNIPCLYIQASKDRMVPSRCLTDFENNIPHLAVKKIEGPHFILQACPEPCLMAVKEFLLSANTSPPGDHLQTVKQQVQDLQKSEAFFRAITQNSSDITIVVNTKGIVTYVNPSVEKVMGYKPEELLGKSGFDFIVPADMPRAFLDFGKSMLTRDVRIPNTFSLKHKNGSVRVLEGIGINLLYDPVVQGFVMNVRDVTDRRRMEQELAASRRKLEETVEKRTAALSLANNRLSAELAERKKAEAALAESEERYRDFLDNAPIGVAIVDLKGQVQYINKRIEHLMGWSHDEIVGKSGFSLDVFDERTRSLFAQRLKTPVKDDTPQIFEIPVQSKSGNRLWVEVIATPLKKDGIPAGARIIFVNLEERKRAEEERRELTERLHRAEKMESLGILAGGIAHELNNILGILVGYAEMVMMKMPDEEPLKKHMHNIIKSSERATSIIQDMQILAGRGVRVSKVIDLNHLLDNVFRTPEFERMRAAHAGVRFTSQPGGNLLRIQGSPSYLEKTIQNLVEFAADDAARNGEVIIRTSNIYLDRPLSGYSDVREGEYVCLTISDPGPAIPSGHVNKIFEPFYTKKVMGRGKTGLELAVVWGTVRDHRGYIILDTAPGQGNTFTLYLPATRETSAEEYQATSPVEAGTSPGASILVVDDMPEQREVAAGLLERLGYRVETAASGEEAVEILKTSAVDLLILDMLMDPGIDGLTTYKRILEIHPRQKAILVSGFTETDRVKEAMDLGAGAYVRKPYLLEEIGAAIRKTLAEK